MKVLSIQVGRPRDVAWHDKVVRTSIFKDAVDGPVRVHAVGLEGDEQSDLTVHGGVDKAVYAYPSEHYEYWRAAYPALQFPAGAFGENLTTEGLGEAGLCIGDRLFIGTAEFRVSQPRMPCFKLGVRFGEPQMTKWFHESARPGFYLAVLREGMIAAGDAITIVAAAEPRFSVAEITRLYTAEDADHDTLRQVIALATLPERLRQHFRRRLGEVEV